MGTLSPQDWLKKVQAAPVNPALKEPIVAYGLFLNGHYNEAAAEWKKAYDATEGADLKVRAMYAASLDRAGNKAESAKIKVEPFLIRDFADVFGAVAFTEMRRLTGLGKAQNKASSLSTGGAAVSVILRRTRLLCTGCLTRKIRQLPILVPMRIRSKRRLSSNQR